MSLYWRCFVYQLLLFAAEFFVIATSSGDALDSFPTLENVAGLMSKVKGDGWTFPNMSWETLRDKYYQAKYHAVLAASPYVFGLLIFSTPIIIYFKNETIHKFWAGVGFYGLSALGGAAAAFVAYFFTRIWRESNFQYEYVIRCRKQAEESRLRIMQLQGEITKKEGNEAAAEFRRNHPEFYDEERINEDFDPEDYNTEKEREKIKLEQYQYDDAVAGVVYAYRDCIIYSRALRIGVNIAIVLVDLIIIHA